MRLGIRWLLAIVFLILAMGVCKAQDDATLAFEGDGPYFSDVAPDYWAYGYIEAIAKANITHGCMRSNDCPGTDDRPVYCPERIVSRAEMAAFVGRAIRFGFDGFQSFNEYIPPTPTFADIAENGLASWIEAIANPVTAGAPEGTKPVSVGCAVDADGIRYYCPDREITRAEMAVFLVRAFGLDFSGYVAQDPTTWSVNFQDVATNYWSWAEIQAFYQSRITIGCRVDGGHVWYCPDEGVTRAELAAFLARGFLGMS